MQKFIPILMIFGLAGCAGAPIMSVGLSAEPGRTGSVVSAEEPVLPSKRVVARRSAGKPAPQAPQAEAVDPNEEQAERAARANDQDVQRLERAAKSATSSICRGC